MSKHDESVLKKVRAFEARGLFNIPEMRRMTLNLTRKMKVLLKSICGRRNLCW